MNDLHVDLMHFPVASQEIHTQRRRSCGENRSARRRDPSEPSLKIRKTVSSREAGAGRGYVRVYDIVDIVRRQPAHLEALDNIRIRCQGLPGGDVTADGL